MADNTGVRIAYQNKDISSKVFGEHLREKSLEVYGFNDLPRIVDVRPTNLPAIEVNELRLDNLFVFEDGSVGIIDYESGYSDENILKYMDYVSRIIRRWYGENGEFPRLRIIIIYTADVSPGSTQGYYDFMGASLTLSEGFLIAVDGDEIYRDIDRKLADGESLTEQDIMRLAIMPLTYRDRDRKQEAVSDAAQLAGGIADDEMKRMALAGIMAFSDKIITEAEAENIRRSIMMTKIEKILEREKREAIDEAVKKNTKEVTEQVTERVTEQVTERVTEQVTEQVTERVTFNLIFDMFGAGEIAREDAMRRAGLSDAEFTTRFNEYKKSHPAMA